jgi:DNA-binding MurR/RpiR family transcriptional regulator
VWSEGCRLAGNCSSKVELCAPPRAHDSLIGTVTSRRMQYLGIMGIPSSSHEGEIMKNQKMTEKTSLIDLSIKPQRAEIAESTSNGDTKKARVVVVTMA